MDTPPLSAEMPSTTQDFLIALTAISTLAISVWAIRAWRRHGTTMPVLVAVGSLLVAFYEPLGDSLLGAYYPEVGQVTALHTFGRDIPLFVLLLYPPYFVPFIVAFCTYAKRGFTARQWWILWISTFAGSAAMELVLMQFGHPWLYHGQQTLVIFGFPLWVTVTNVTFLFLTGAVVHLIVTRLPSGRRWMLVLAVPITTAAGHLVVALPGAAARESEQDTVMLIGGCASLLLAVAIANALSLAFVSRATVSSRERQTA